MSNSADCGRAAGVAPAHAYDGGVIPGGCAGPASSTARALFRVVGPKAIVP